jgi:acyl-CoA thioester hydrolase
MSDSLSPAALAVGGVFRHLMPMRWGDLDALNHVNNTLYFRYFEDARMRLFTQADIESSSRAAVLAHASCDFLKPLHYPATVIVKLVLARMGRSSLDVDNLIEVEGEPGVVYARGKSILVGVDPASGRSSPWTPDEAARLASCFRQ